MALTPLLQTMVTVTLSAALPLFALGAFRYRESAFGDVLLTFPAVLAFAVGAATVDELAISAGTLRAVMLVAVGAAAVLSLVGALRLFRLASGRWSV